MKPIQWGILLGIGFVLAIANPSWGYHWERVAHFGLTATDGNSQASTASVRLEAQVKEVDYVFRTAMSTTYGQAEGVTSADKSSAVAQYNRFMTERLSAYLNIGGDRDRIADLLWRLQVGPGVGYFFIKEDHGASLSGDLGVTYFRERYKDTETNHYFALRTAERGEWYLTDAAKIWEMLEYFRSFNPNDKRFILKGEAGLESPITERTSVRLLIQDIYNSNPAVGKERNDVTYIAAVGFKF